MADKKTEPKNQGTRGSTGEDRNVADVDETLPLPSDHPDGQDSTQGNAPAAPADITPGALNVHDDSDDHDLEPDTKPKSN